MPRAIDPQVSFADWELMQQGMALDALLAAISDLLEGHHGLIEQVRVDLERGLKRPELGRDGLTPPQVATGPALAGLDADQKLAISLRTRIRWKLPSCITRPPSTVPGLLCCRSRLPKCGQRKEL